MSETKVREKGLMGRAVRVRASAMTSDPFTAAQPGDARLQRW